MKNTVSTLQSSSPDDTRAVPWIRSFTIDGQERIDQTYRTALIEYFSPVAGCSVLDLGASDGYESRALVMRGAARALALDGRPDRVAEAVAARDALGVVNQDVRVADVRALDVAEVGTFDIVLCFGLLYHMEDPFALLKAIRPVTAGRLFLETHVAPERWRDLLPKHRHAFSRWAKPERRILGGVPFDGMVYRQPSGHSKGSLDAPHSFWLTRESLLKAVVRAGFVVEAYYHELDDQCPEPVQTWGSLLMFGRANTKVWIVAH